MTAGNRQYGDASFQAAGGEAGIFRLVNDFFARTGADERVKTDPFFQDPTGDPRWEPMLQRIGLKDAQIAAIQFGNN